MITKHFEPKKTDLWRDLLEHSLIFPVTPLQCAPKNPWRPLRGPRRPDGDTTYRPRKGGDTGSECGF
eukprot:285447-Pyramimonas_sp.AAC.1